MKSIIIPFNKDLCFLNECNFEIDNYKWTDNNYKPVVKVFLCHNNEKIKIKFISYEGKIRVEEMNDNGEVYSDSCVEFFMRPFEDDLRYINFEVNPNGAMIMSIGESRFDRSELVFKYKSKLNLKAKIERSYWTTQFEIPFNMLNEIYNMNNLKEITQIKGNFYKCGDKTEYPHYGMWNDIDKETPDYHIPKYFGTLILE